jgi:hypothetical protein
MDRKMIDICKHCFRSKDVHSKYYQYCYVLVTSDGQRDYKDMNFNRYNAMSNLEYLEWKANDTN